MHYNITILKGKCPRGIAQWINHSPAARAAGVQTWTCQVFSASILLGTPSCALSLTMPVVMCSSMNTCHGRGKKERNLGKILAAASVRQNTDMRAMYERKGGKNF